MSLVQHVRLFFFICLVSVLIFSCSNNTVETLSEIRTHDSILNPIQSLGKRLFFDASLSNPIGQSCASCHSPGNGFVDPGIHPVSAGALKHLFGSRNAPSISYAAFTPYFHYDSLNKEYVGGLFWDGRVNTLAEQAVQPLLNHLEMNNSNRTTIIERIKKSAYRDLFLSVFGSNSLADTNKAFVCVTEAIEEYEETKEVNPFTSKFDYYLAGKVQLSKPEIRGLKLFEDSTKGNCAACHPNKPDKFTNAVLFTDYTYDNLGLPANPEIAALCKENKCDAGLGFIVKQKSADGKFKVPTLRNVAVTAPYFHNGVIKTLLDAVRFYNERDAGKFGPPEVAENVNKKELGDLKLNEQEVGDIVAFLETLTDGYKGEMKK